MWARSLAINRRRRKPTRRLSTLRILLWFFFKKIFSLWKGAGLIERMKGLNFAQGLVRAPWTCRACTRQIRQPVVRAPRVRSYATAAPTARRGLSLGTILIRATVGSAVITAAVYPDDMKHAYQACQRSGRVVVALAKCINEYVLQGKIMGMGRC